MSSSSKKRKTSPFGSEIQLCFGKSFKLMKTEQGSDELPKHDEKTTKTPKEFLSKWLLDFRCLYYDKEENAMFCNWCRLFPDYKNAFIKGCRNFQKSALDKHTITNDHIKAVKKHDPLIQGMML